LITPRRDLQHGNVNRSRVGIDWATIWPVQIYTGKTVNNFFNDKDLVVRVIYVELLCQELGGQPMVEVKRFNLVDVFNSLKLIH
jgi:hypothetical protein